MRADTERYSIPHSQSYENYNPICPYVSECETISTVDSPQQCKLSTLLTKSSNPALGLRFTVRQNQIGTRFPMKLMVQLVDQE